MSAKKINARLTFTQGESVYPELAALNGDSTAIRRRLHALIHMGVIAEAAIKGMGSAPYRGSLPPGSVEHPTHDTSGTARDKVDTKPQETMSPTKPAVPRLNLSGLPG